LPYTTLHTYGIEKKRADALRAVAKHAHFLHRLAESSLPAHELTQKLHLIPGVGVWTAAVAGGLAFGDPDALQVGDFHVKNTVAYALTGAIEKATTVAAAGDIVLMNLYYEFTAACTSIVSQLSNGLLTMHHGAPRQHVQAPSSTAATSTTASLACRTSR
jgi:hypothetical protein